MTGTKTTFAHGQLKSIVERIERLEEEKKTIAADIKEVYAEAKANGFDTKILRKVISLRKKEAAEREEEQSMLDVYMAALGMIPGEARGGLGRHLLQHQLRAPPGAHRRDGLDDGRRHGLAARGGGKLQFLRAVHDDPRLQQHGGCWRLLQDPADCGTRRHHWSGSSTSRFSPGMFSA